MKIQSELMDAAEAAEFLHLKPATLSNWRSTKRQKLPYVKIGGRAFYRAIDLQKWIEQNIVNKIN